MTYASICHHFRNFSHFFAKKEVVTEGNQEMK